MTLDNWLPASGSYTCLGMLFPPALSNSWCLAVIFADFMLVKVDFRKCNVTNLNILSICLSLSTCHPITYTLHISTTSAFQVKCQTENSKPQISTALPKPHHRQHNLRNDTSYLLTAAEGAIRHFLLQIKPLFVCTFLNRKTLCLFTTYVAIRSITQSP